MADRRPRGIEKIAHLFIAGHGASALRARDNSPHPWAGPVAPPKAGANPADMGVPIIPAADNPNDRAAGAEASVASPPDVPADPAVSPCVDEPAACVPPAAPKPEVSPALKALLGRAQVVAVLTGHMGPLAGPAAEACARGLARRDAPAAMLYGPAEFACLHQFMAGEPSADGNGHAGATESCDTLLLPDWVFQFDLWPAGRPVASIALGYAAGSEGLMAAYGALKGLISRFGKPEEVWILPFGCNEQEEAWGQERLVEMCRRFLEITPKPLGDDMPELRVQAGPLQSIAGGIDGVKELLDSIGQVRLAVVRPGEPRPVEAAVQANQSSALPENDQTMDITVLTPVERMPADGQDVLKALLAHRQVDGHEFFDIWRRGGLAGTILDGEGFIGIAGSSHDLLGFALWLCRQAQLAGDDLSSITIATAQPDDWQIEAAEAMPVHVEWLTWQVFQLDGRIGLSFEAE